MNMFFKILLFVFILIYTGHTNPIVLFHINEFQIDSSGWKLELKNLNLGIFTSLDSCYLTTLDDTAFFKPGIVINNFLIVNQDSMIDNLIINRDGDIISFHYLDGYPLDQIRFGNISGYSMVAVPLAHQSICLKEWFSYYGFQQYFYYLDNTPTFGHANDNLNAIGYIDGYVMDSLGVPIQGAEIEYDYDDFHGSIYVVSDSTGYFVISEYARQVSLEIRKGNFQNAYRTLQVWPEDTVSINITLNAVIDIINNNVASQIENFNLSQNFPNPFNNTTSFNYSIPEAGFVEISIFDLNGKLVDKLFSGKQNSGSYKVNWNAQAYSSGVYLYQIKTNNLIKNKKCLLIK